MVNDSTHDSTACTVHVIEIYRRCEGVFRRLYAGHQCYFCGVRFQVSEETASSGGSVGPAEGESAAELARYRSHLDAHYLKRHQQQQSTPGAGGQQHRKWFLCANDWLAYRPEASQTPLPEADTDERERAFALSATTTGATGEAGVLAVGGASASVKTESGVVVDPRIDYQPASTDVAEVCPHPGSRAPDLQSDGGPSDHTAIRSTLTDLKSSAHLGIYSNCFQAFSFTCTRACTRIAP